MNTNLDKNLTVVIMSGGSGTRLWPLSRELYPKQFQKLVDDKYTMFQLSCISAISLNPKKIIVVCNDTHKFLVSEQMKELDINDYLVICEPFGKNTASAIACASCCCNENDMLFVMTADHVWDNIKLQKAVEEGLTINDNQNIIVFGIKPTYPETGYGYIKHKDNKLIKFIEKPKMDDAIKYLEQDYLWNSGNFLFQNKYMLSEFVKHSKEIITQVKETIEKSELKNNFLILNSKEFNKVYSISIDYAIMEKQLSGYVIKYDGVWKDIGSLFSLYDYKKKGFNNNLIEGDIKTLDTKNCYIKSNKLVTTLGIKNLAIIDTEDALLISDLKMSQNIKDVVNNLKEENREEIYCHKLVYRPWGFYKNIEGNDKSGFKVKRILVYPGKKLSLQSHNHRSEHWVIVKGTGKVQVGADFLTLTKNMHVFIPKETMHRMENIGNTNLEFIETQVGSYLGEDDIVRYQDDFGRV